MDDRLSFDWSFYVRLSRIAGAICIVLLLVAANVWLLPECGPIVIWCTLNLLVVAFFIWRTTRRYGTLLNPVAFFGGYYTMAAIVAPNVYSTLGLFNDVQAASVRKASLLSSLYFASLGIAFLLKSSPAKLFFRWLLRISEPIHITKENGVTASRFLMLQSALLFVVLMLASGVGTMWITDSREAYQMHRASVGVVWSLCEASVLLAFICYLFARVRTFAKLVIVTIPFAGAALFLGSKAATMAYFVIALFYADLKIRPITAKVVMFVGAFILTGALLVQLGQGTAEGGLDTLIYFDYFSNSAHFLDRFDEFGFRYGTMTLSYLWYYVPRALYAAKPFVYGQVQATEMLFPGFAEAIGATPGLMQWTAGYGDFGYVGVVLTGLFSGFISKGAFELFRERKDIMAAAIFAQIGLIYYIELFDNAPFAIFMVWLLFQMLSVWFLRWLVTPVLMPRSTAPDSTRKGPTSVGP